MANSRDSTLSASVASWAERFLALVRRWAELSLAFVRRAPDLVALVAMALLGFGISVYLTTVHYAKVPLVCNTGGIINCASVTTSAYSVIPGTSIPITVPGMLWFAVSGALAVVALVALQRGQAEPERLRLAQVVWGGLGLVFVLYLVYAEIVKLRQICEWCTAVHILTLLTFLVALYRFQQAQAGMEAVADEGADQPAPSARSVPAATNKPPGARRAQSASGGTRGALQAGSRTGGHTASRGRRR